MPNPIEKYLRVKSKKPVDKYKAKATLSEVFLMLFVFAIMLFYSSIAISFQFFHALQTAKSLFENLYYYYQAQEARADSLQALTDYYSKNWEEKHPFDRPGERYDKNTHTIIPSADYEDWKKKKDLVVPTKFSRDVVFRAGTVITLPNGDNPFGIDVKIDGKTVVHVDAHTSPKTNAIDMRYVGKTVTLVKDDGEVLKDNAGVPITYKVLDNIDAQFIPSFLDRSYAKAYYNPNGICELGQIIVSDPEDIYDQCEVAPISENSGLIFSRKSNKKWTFSLSVMAGEALLGTKLAFDAVISGTEPSPARGFSILVMDDDVYATVSYKARDSKKKEWKTYNMKIKFPPGDRY